MLFNSFHFFAFLPVVLFVYFFLPFRWRNSWLLISSLYFYGSWKLSYLAILGVGATLDWALAIAVEQAKDSRRRFLWLLASLASNCGALFFFKYYDFFASQVNLATHQPLLPALQIALPIGISFYLFQSMGYVLDVYRGVIPAERSLPFFLLFVSYFPHMVAGPIQRSQHLMSQLREHFVPDPARFVRGLRWMLWGFFKKVVIADNLADYVTYAYDAGKPPAGCIMAIATVFFAYQIYCDFSGYSDIARGASLLFGVELMVNFNRPYSSASVTEFWQRWHISLSTWFRDYLYIPLGGNRVSPLVWVRNILIVFLVSGLWHGSNWTFVVWGGIHATMFCIERLALQPLGWEKAHRSLRVMGTFLVVCIAWVFFRSPSLEYASQVFGQMFFKWGNLARLLSPIGTRIYVLFGLIGFLELVQWRMKQKLVDDWMGALPIPLRWTLYLVLICLLLYAGDYQERDFIYFQF
jgi:alginate O-acetyltransferase complex protein AlgI